MSVKSASTSAALSTQLSETGEKDAKDKEKKEVEVKPVINTTPDKRIQLNPWRKFKSANNDSSRPLLHHNGGILMKKCINLPNGNMIFSEPSHKLIDIYDQEGSFIKKMYLSGRPFDIAVISNKLIAISYGESQFVEIIDLKSESVVRTFSWETNCFGIAVLSNCLFVVIEWSGIVVIDHVTGEIVKTLPVKLSQKTFLEVTENSIVYTNCVYNTVNCLDHDGNEKWVFKRVKLNRPIGIAVTKEGEVFVAGNLSGNIYYISPDGQKFKELIKDKNIIDIDFDEHQSRLLVSKSDGSAFKYFVEYGN